MIQLGGRPVPGFGLGTNDPAVVRQSVIDQWIPFNTAQLTWTDADGKTQHSPDEGVVPWMYCDVLGYVTTGMGILIETGGTQGTDVRKGGTASTGGSLTQLGLRAGWKRSDGSLASDEEIQAEFANIKAHTQEYAQSGHTGVQYTLHLDNGVVNENGPSVQALTATKLQGFADMLKSQLPAFDTFPADGQMGLLSHSWAMGAWLGKWPKMKAAADQTPHPDWRTVAQEDYSTTYAPARQASNIRCYLNAEGVDRGNGDPAVLYFPENVGSGIHSASVQSVAPITTPPMSEKIYKALAPYDVIAQVTGAEAIKPPLRNARDTYAWIRKHQTGIAIATTVAVVGTAALTLLPRQRRR